ADAEEFDASGNGEVFAGACVVPAGAWLCANALAGMASQQASINAFTKKQRAAEDRRGMRDVTVAANCCIGLPLLPTD
ncbi:MAG: hypothetical protein ABSC47_10415, partial [Terracidiphilus sp.]